MTDRGFQLSPRVYLTPGDPVKVARKHGLYRFVGVRDDGKTADVVGPIGKVELMRVVALDLLRSAGRVTREQVAMPADQRQVSDNAKSWKRGRR